MVGLCPIHAGEAVAYQLLAEILSLRVGDKAEVTLHLAVALGIHPFRPDRERPLETVLGEVFGRLAHFQNALSPLIASKPESHHGSLGWHG